MQLSDNIKLLIMEIEESVLRGIATYLLDSGYEVLASRPRVVGWSGGRVVGSRRAVIRSRGRAYTSVRGISGATIPGDGSVAPILGVPQLVQALEAA
jgi:hypothetical protein